MKILLANPRGFCAGVVMAIESLESALKICGPPVYVYHQIVHNRHVVEDFERRGAVFVHQIDQVPPGSVLLFSAHGVSPDVRRQARARALCVIDATCPLVAKVHAEAIRWARDGYAILLIGHRGHDEAVGTIGEAPGQIQIVQSAADVDALQLPQTEKVAYLMQTTLSVDDAQTIVERLRMRFPAIVGPSKDDICYATQNRQRSLKELVPEADLVLVVGSENSSNSQRLVEVAAARGRPAYLIDRPDDIDPRWFRNAETVVLTAGASAPDAAVRDCLAYLCDGLGGELVERPGIQESVRFPLPRELQTLAST